MIEIVQATDGRGVYVRLYLDYPLDPKAPLDFYRAGASPIESALLEQHIDKQIWKRMQEIRKVSYLTGWRHKASKKIKKRTEFSESITISMWEYKEAGL